MMTSKPHLRPFISFILIGLVGSLVQAQSYAPINVTCPTDLIRYGDNGLSPLETQYIAQRRTKATENLATWLGLVGLQDFNVSSFLANQSNAPTLAIAFSGGGYRAMLNGAGVFQGNNNNIVRVISDGRFG
jgi:lysophospholipase